MPRRALASAIVSASLACAAACLSPSSNIDDHEADAAVEVVRTDTSTPDARPDFDEIPCGARRVLQTTCQQCHTRPPQRGAPFALVHRSDLFVSHETALIRDLMIAQIETRRMPVAPVTMDEDARVTLLAWLRDGAPASARDSCVDSGIDADAASSDATTETGPSSDAEADAESDAAQ